MAALEEARWLSFSEELIRHCYDFAPELCRVAGELNVRKAVKFGISQGRKYGFDRHGPLRLYIEMMLSFGIAFDSDPLLPWAGRVLSEKGLGQMVRTEKLYLGMVEYADHVMGPQNEYALQSLTRLVRTDLTDLTLRNDLHVAIVEVMQTIFPQKCIYVGDDPINALLKEALSVCAEHAVISAAGFPLLAGLMFGFGHGVTRDFMYPWVAKTLTDPLVTDPNVRIRRLHRKILTYAQHALTASRKDFKSIELHCGT